MTNILTNSESHLLRVNPLGHELPFDEGPDLGLLAGEPGHPLAGLVEAKVAHDEGRRYLGVVEIHACSQSLPDNMYNFPCKGLLEDPTFWLPHATSC